MIRIAQHEQGTEGTMRRIAAAAAVFVTVGSLVFASFGAETIITSGGSVLTGVIETGLPATVSVTSDTGDVFTVKRENMKHIRFGERLEVTVETVDGNIIVGTLGGISDVFGLKTEGGDVQSISVDSIVEIRFEPPVAEAVEQPVVTTVGPAPSSVQGVVDVYEDRAGSFTLGIDSGLQLGYSVKNGFGTPRFTIGVNGILLGVVGRLYFTPSVERVERVAERFVSDGVADFETLLEETRAETTPFLVPYLQLGTDAFIIPHLGGGLLLQLGRLIYFDLGATIDTVGVPWLSVGLLIFF
jgi:hypothetical protein